MDRSNTQMEQDSTQAQQQQHTHDSTTDVAAPPVEQHADMAAPPAEEAISPAGMPVAPTVSAPSSAEQQAAADAAGTTSAVEPAATAAQLPQTGQAGPLSPAAADNLVAMLQAVVAQQASKPADSAPPVSPQSAATTSHAAGGTAPPAVTPVHHAAQAPQSVSTVGPNLDMLQSVFLAVGVLRSIAQGQAVAPAMALYAAQQLAANATPVQRLQQMHSQLLPLVQLQQQRQLEAAAAAAATMPMQGPGGGTRSSSRGQGIGRGAVESSEAVTKTPVATRKRGRPRKRPASGELDSGERSMQAPRVEEAKPASAGMEHTSGTATQSGGAFAGNPALASIVQQLMAHAPHTPHVAAPIRPQAGSTGPLLTALAMQDASCSAAGAALAGVQSTASATEPAHRIVTSTGPAVLTAAENMSHWILSGQQITSEAPAAASSAADMPSSADLVPGSAATHSNLLSPEGARTVETSGAEQPGKAPATE